ncbi:hypothetical protein FGRMN_8091 [Fusarium graminum]|nr:hypothetical protein FGRMN_8091 [Fusarium graminum]
MPIRRIRNTDADAIRLLVDSVNDVFNRIAALTTLHESSEPITCYLPGTNYIRALQSLFMYWVDNFPNIPQGQRLETPPEFFVPTPSETAGNPLRLEELIVWLEDLCETIARKESRKAYTWYNQIARFILNIYDYGVLSAC